MGKKSVEFRNIAKLVLTDAASRVFDNFYNILKERYSKKNAEKVIVFKSYFFKINFYKFYET